MRKHEANMKKSEIRKDYLLDRYVIIAPKRSKRPEQIKEAMVVVSTNSPFTPANLKKDKRVILDSIGNGSEQIVVIPNIFPAVTMQNPKARGAQEVIIDTPDPSARLADLSVNHIALLLTMYGRRVKAIMKLKKFNIFYV